MIREWFSRFTSKRETIDGIEKKGHNDAKEGASAERSERLARLTEHLNRELHMGDKAMEEKNEGRKKKARFLTALTLGTTLLAAPGLARGDDADWARALGRAYETTVNRLGGAVETSMRESTRRQSDVLRKERDVEVKSLDVQQRMAQELEETKRRLAETEARLKIEQERTTQQANRNDSDVRKTRIQAGARVQEREIQDTERTRQKALDKGIHEVGSDTENTGEFGTNRRKRNSDAMSIPGMHQAVPGDSGFEPAPGQREEAPEDLERTEGRRKFGDPRPLDREDETALRKRAIQDHKRGEPDEAFYTDMTEEEARIYGNEWNQEEKLSRDKTQIILRPSDRRSRRT